MILVRFLKFLLAFAVPVVLGISALLSFWWSCAPTRSAPVRVEVRDGASLIEVTRRLEEANVVRWSPLFRFYAEFEGAARGLKVGEYEFAPGALPSEVLEKLLKGSYVLVEYSHPPGLNLYQVAARLGEAFPHVSQKEWVKILKDPTPVRDLAPEARTLEGYLYPDVYRIRAYPRAEEVIQMMLKNFRNRLTPEIVKAGERRGLSLHRVVTLASIIEKETGVGSERSLISAVFHSRLKKRMRLQTDPTVIYGIWERFDGNLRKVDLQTPTPYNTYAIEGLPPGPIANPGFEALEAAVAPAQSEYLFFVARGDGTHYFSKSLTEHVQAVNRFQISPSRKKQP